MPNSNAAASNEMLWERVLSLLVVGASVLGGSTVLLIQALPSSVSIKRYAGRVPAREPTEASWTSYPRYEAMLMD